MARRNINQHLLKQFLAQCISVRRARSLAKSDATLWVRATAAQLGMRGLANSTERYVPKGTKRVTEKTKRQLQKKQTGLSLERRAALIRSGERVSGRAAKQAQTKSAIRRLLENLAGVTNYEDRRQIEAARERAGLTKSQFTHWRRNLRESANPFVKSGSVGSL